MTERCSAFAGVELVLIQPFLLYYVNHVALMLTGIFKHNFHKKRKRFVSKQDQLLSWLKSLTFTQRLGY